ncbi:MAG: hypothetical protein JWO42_3799 [Chloroflexi bacterium]|jgi:glycosyltransferase involved in cell wall biosynthesis|nr:hypothetical protein [Chloroflexota bacterium]
MRIVHAVSNVAGLPVAFAEAQRRAGHRAAAVVYESPYYKDVRAVDLGRLLDGNRISRKLRRARVVAWAAHNFDVFHFHYYTTFMPNQEDLQLLKTLGKKVVFHLHGCDIRDPRRVRTEHAISACAECTIECLTPVKLRMQTTLDRFADAVIVSTPDLLEFVPDAQYIPNPIDPRSWNDLRESNGLELRTSGEYVIVHAPTNREIKGTRHIEAAVDQLRSEGLAVRLQLLEGLTQDKLHHACLEADLVIDQVLIGWFGLFALEMMALGKPVLAYIREDLQHAGSEVPIASASPENLARTIRRLLTSSTEREELSRRGPAYIQSVHNLDRINEQVMDIYRAIGAP